MINDSIVIDNEYDEDGNEIESLFVVELSGKPNDVFSTSHEYFDSDVDAHDFAEQVSEETGVKITWNCYRPAWA